MKYLLIILTMCALFGCSRRVAPTRSQVEIRDSIVNDTTVIIKDTIIYRPGDSVKIRVTIPCPDAKIDTVLVSASGKTTARLQIKNGNVEVDCKTDSLQVVIQLLRRELIRQASFHSRKETIEVPVEVPVYKMPKWVWYLIMFNLVYFGIRYAGPLGRIAGGIANKFGR
jgi:hypothetical protein